MIDENDVISHLKLSELYNKIKTSKIKTLKIKYNNDV